MNQWIQSIGNGGLSNSNPVCKPLRKASLNNSKWDSNISGAFLSDISRKALDDSISNGSNPITWNEDCSLRFIYFYNKHTFPLDQGAMRKDKGATCQGQVEDSAQ